MNENRSDQLHEEHEINLNTTDDFKPNYTEKIIDTFIQFFSDQDITINDFNAISLNYLSRKYEIQSLTEKTENYIQNHYYNLNKKYITENIGDVQYEEHFLVYFCNFYQNIQLIQLPIQKLYRILSLYFNSESIESISTKIKCLINFLNNCIKEKGNEAFQLFPLFCFENDELNDQIYSQINFFSEFDTSQNLSKFVKRSK